jgi:hypothetical protein
MISGVIGNSLQKNQSVKPPSSTQTGSKPVPISKRGVASKQTTHYNNNYNNGIVNGSRSEGGDE